MAYNLKHRSVLENLFDILKDGNAEELLRVFVGEPVIETPLDREIIGEDSFREFVSSQREWLHGNNVTASHFATTEDTERRVDEFRLKMRKDSKEIKYPAASVADLADKGITKIRLYHTTEPILGYEIVRHPTLAPNKDLKFPETIDKYFKAIAKTDVEKVMPLWEEDGYLVGWGIPIYVRDNLKEFFAGGDIPLKHCTVTFDGIRCAVEYILDEWGSKKMPAQQGVVVYELSEKNKMRYARIYDNITPPDNVNILCEY